MDLVNCHLEKARESQKKQYDKTVRSERTYAIGDKVKLVNSRVRPGHVAKFELRFTAPYIVKRIDRDGLNYEIEDETGRRLIVHYNQIDKYIERRPKHNNNPAQPNSTDTPSRDDSESRPVQRDLSWLTSLTMLATARSDEDSPSNHLDDIIESVARGVLGQAQEPDNNQAETDDAEEQRNQEGLIDDIDHVVEEGVEQHDVPVISGEPPQSPDPVDVASDAQDDYDYESAHEGENVETDFDNNELFGERESESDEASGQEHEHEHVDPNEVQPTAQAKKRKPRKVINEPRPTVTRSGRNSAPPVRFGSSGH